MEKPPYHKPEIIASLDEVTAHAATWFDQQPDDQFDQGPAGKWCAGQHLDHLIRSTTPVTLALKLPRIFPAMLFGKATKASRDFGGVVEIYKAALSDGGKASGRFVPGSVARENKAALLERYRHESRRLSFVIERWPERDLDTYRLPHPLLGKLTVREMLLFTIFHTQCHLEILARDYA